MSRFANNARLCAVALVLILMLCSLLPPSPAHAQQSSSAEGRLVNILLTVLDKDKRFVTTLRKEDIRLLEDGAQQEIGVFQQQTDQPLSIMIMIDTSVSQERVLPGAKLVARSFIDSIIRPGKDRVGVITFTGRPTVELALTDDPTQAQRAIERVEFKPPTGYVAGGLVMGKPPKSVGDQPLPGSTAIWDAVWFVSEKIFEQPLGQTRRVVILLTDGQDTSSKHKLNEAIERAIQSNAIVYSIGVGDKYYDGVDEATLRKMSEQTGARAFFPQKMKDLQAAFAEIEQELRSAYLISYLSANRKADDKMRKIKIEVVNPELRKQGLQLSYQPGYYAKND